MLELVDQKKVMPELLLNYNDDLIKYICMMGDANDYSYNNETLYWVVSDKWELEIAKVKYHYYLMLFYLFRELEVGRCPSFWSFG